MEVPSDLSNSVGSEKYLFCYNHWIFVLLDILHRRGALFSKTDLGFELYRWKKVVPVPVLALVIPPVPTSAFNLGVRPPTRQSILCPSSFRSCRSTRLSVHSSVHQHFRLGVCLPVRQRWSSSLKAASKNSAQLQFNILRTTKIRWLWNNRVLF